jgi:hypothetical protein
VHFSVPVDTTRAIVRRSLEALQARLQEDEEAVYLAVGAGQAARLRDYVPGTLVFFALLIPLVVLFGYDGSGFWIAFAIAFAVSLAVDLAVRRRGGRRMVSAALLAVTNRRVLYFEGPDLSAEVPLEMVESVKRVKVGIASATLRITAPGLETEVQITSDWPKRTAKRAADEIAAHLDSRPDPGRGP